MEQTPRCVDLVSLTTSLPVIPYQKLTDLRYLSNGGFGTVFKAQHSDWRTMVAIKCLKLDSPVGEWERTCLLKEAEILHKARFNYIIQIFGVCDEPEFFGIVTEYMVNGSLDLLLHEKTLYPVLPWGLRLRVLYEIALGVNFLHHMTPPLVHHDLKTQNILLDKEFHVKIADFGLSKWRQLSISNCSGSKPAEMAGTVIYMPPEEYEPSKNRRTDVKHDMYSYAIIMWEVLSRRMPFEEATNPIQIMFSVLRGSRPDTGPDSLPEDTPRREALVNLMMRGWTANPDDRPSFLNCLMVLEPVVRSFDEIHVLEAILEVKRSKLMIRAGCCSAMQAPVCAKMMEEEETKTKKESLYNNNSPCPWPTRSTSGSGSGSSHEAEISQPGFLVSIIPPPKDTTLSSFMPDPLELPCPLRVPRPDSDLNHDPLPLGPTNNLNIPLKPDSPPTDCGETGLDNTEPKPQSPDSSPPVKPLALAPGPIARWMAERREQIVRQMTEACLNQSLDALLARSLLMHEDYELVVNQPTRTAKVRQLLDTCHRHRDDFCRVVVRKLQDNKQLGLQPYPPELCSPAAGAAAVPTAPPLSASYNNKARN